MLARWNFDGPHVRHNRRTLSQDAQKGPPLRLWFIWCVLFIELVFFNQTNETDQIMVFLRWRTFQHPAIHSLIELSPMAQ